jgi:hypothetical protein
MSRIPPPERSRSIALMVAFFALLTLGFPAFVTGQRGNRQAIERVQQDVQSRLQRSEGRDARVNFNNDANTQWQNGQDIRVTGSGDVWRDNRRRSFYYQGTVGNRDGNLFNVRTDWRGGWLNDNNGGGRPPGNGGGRPPWDGGNNGGGNNGGGRPPGGSSGGYLERPNGRVSYSGPITNEETGKVLDVAGWSREDGANVQQWSFAGQRNQRWDVIDVGRGDVAIVSQNSGRVLDVSGFSTSSGGNVQQFRWSGQDNQRWRIESTGRGTVRIINVNSRKCLDVTRKNKDDGANIHQWDCNDDRSQQWRLGGH